MLKSKQRFGEINLFVIHVYISRTPVVSTSSAAHAQIQADSSFCEIYEIYLFVLHVYISHTPVVSTPSSAHAQVQALGEINLFVTHVYISHTPVAILYMRLVIQ